MNTKSFLNSKTLWFNALALLTIIAGSLGFSNFQPDAWVGELGTVIVLVINMVLRLKTTQRLSLK